MLRTNDHKHNVEEAARLVPTTHAVRDVPGLAHERLNLAATLATRAGCYDAADVLRTCIQTNPDRTHGYTDHEWAARVSVKSIPGRQPQRQDSTNDQLDTVCEVLRRLGFEKAALDIENLLGKES